MHVMFEYLYIHIYIYIYIWLYVCLCRYVCMYVFVRVFVRVHVHTFSATLHWMVFAQCCTKIEKEKEPGEGGGGVRGVGGWLLELMLQHGNALFLLRFLFIFHFVAVLIYFSLLKVGNIPGWPGFEGIPFPTKTGLRKRE